MSSMHMFNKILETIKLLQEKFQSNFIIYCENIYFTKLESKNKVAYEGLLTLCKFGQTLHQLLQQRRDTRKTQQCLKVASKLVIGFRSVNIYIVLPIFTTEVQYSLNNLLEGDNIKIQCVLMFLKALIAFAFKKFNQLIYFNMVFRIMRLVIVHK